MSPQPSGRMYVCTDMHAWRYEKGERKVVWGIPKLHLTKP